MFDQAREFMEGHEFFMSVAKQLLARQNAQEQLILALFTLIAGGLSEASRRSLIDDLYAIGEQIKTSDWIGPTMDADERLDGADLARLSSESISNMVDSLVRSLPPTPAK
jgi:hypothetical protein